MITESIVSALSLVYLFMIVETIFSSTKNIMERQQAFEGRLIFLIYSLIVYYKNFRLKIILWDTFINEPIIHAYSLMDKFMTGIFGLSIQADPWFIFKFLIPAAFIYNFVNYWVKYGFNDSRISRMMSFAAVVMFLYSGSNLGFISSWTIPLGGVPFSGMLIPMFVEFLPIDNLAGEPSFILSFTQDNELMSALVILVVYAIFAFLFYYASKEALKKAFSGSIKSGFSALAMIVYLAIPAVILLATSFLAGFDPLSMFPMILKSMVFVGGLGILAIVGELLAFGALLLIFNSFRIAFTQKE